MVKSKRSLMIVLWTLGILVPISFLSQGYEARAGQEGPHVVSGDLFSATVISEDVYVMVGDRGIIYLSKDGAKTWNLVDSSTKRALAAVCFPDDRFGWVVGQGGVILHSPDGGRTWLAQSSGIDKYLLDVDFIDSRHGLAVGADATVMMTTDGGKTWRRSSFEPPRDLEEMEEGINIFAVVMLDTRQACIAGEYGRIFRTEDGGQTWTEAASPLYDPEMMEGKILYCLAHHSGSLLAAGIDGVLVHSRDQGRNWKEIDTGFSGPELYCLDVVDNVALAAGSGGHIIKTSDGGLTWQVVEVPERITRFWLSGLELRKTPSGIIHGLIAGQAATFGHLTDGKLRWQ